MIGYYRFLHRGREGRGLRCVSMVTKTNNTRHGDDEDVESRMATCLLASFLVGSVTASRKGRGGGLRCVSMVTKTSNTRHGDDEDVESHMVTWLLANFLVGKGYW